MQHASHAVRRAIMCKWVVLACLLLLLMLGESEGLEGGGSDVRFRHVGKTTALRMVVVVLLLQLMLMRVLNLIR